MTTASLNPPPTSRLRNVVRDHPAPPPEVAPRLVPPLPGEPDRYRGVSCTAMAFRARDYASLFPNVADVDELLIGTAARDGRLEYVVDYTIFGHHINYWSVRKYLTRNQPLVRAYSQRVISLSDGDQPAAWTPPPFHVDAA